MPGIDESRSFIPLNIAVLTVSDTRKLVEDRSGDTLVDRLTKAGHMLADRAIVTDDVEVIAGKVREWISSKGVDVIITTGGTGFTGRDVTPEATLAVADKEMPGFGEQMRQISLKFVPTAILSRQVAVIRGQSLIINLPGQPKSIAETLEGLKDADGQAVVHGIFAAVPYCVDLIGGAYMETNDTVCAAFRPKAAQRPRP
jgi:molybdopterin adenylyltransferase